MIAQALEITGPFNIQFMGKDNDVQVIECNLRASRTFPFVSKTLNHNFISLATQAMCGLKVQPYRISLLDIDYVCVKAPMFSFTRLRGADPNLGVEMASTGEVACFGDTEHEAFMQAMISAKFKLPSKEKFILLSIASDTFRDQFWRSAKVFQDLGYKLLGTPGTAAFMKAKGVEIGVVKKPADEEDEDDCAETGAPSALKEIRQRNVTMVINISEDTSRKDEITAGYIMRRAAVDFDISLVTNIKCAVEIAEALERGYDKFEAKHIGEFYKLPMIGWRK